MKIPKHLPLGIIILFSLLVSGCGGGVSNAYAPTQEGNVFAKQGELEAAIEKFELAIGLDPTRHSGWTPNFLQPTTTAASPIVI